MTLFQALSCANLRLQKKYTYSQIKWIDMLLIIDQT